MATSTYLKADPIKGESTDDKHADWMELFEFELGVAQPVSGPSGAGGRGSATPDFTHLTVRKGIDTATPDLNIYCAKGDHIKKLELEVCQETGSKVCYFKVVFHDVMVSSVINAGGGSNRPSEKVTFIFDKIEYNYTPIKNDGTAGTPIGPKIWDLTKNKPE